MANAKSMPKVPYPRPDFDRSDRWASLNGTWDFFPDPGRVLDIATFGELAAPETIRVPSCWEQGASGGRHDWIECGWYRRRVRVPAEWRDDRVILHFGAVFHSCTVWVNGWQVVEHVGGYLPFEADISDVVEDEHATIVVRVEAPRDKRDIPHGKQRSIPYDDYNGCSFTPTSGIWQHVWMEPRSSTYIGSLTLMPTPELDGIDVTAEVAGKGTGRISVLLDGNPVAESAAAPVVRLTVPVAEPRLWSPSDPHLYAVSARLVTEEGTDVVRGWTGLRTFEARDGVFLLNGERIYLRGVLDHGYWPDSGLAAPSDDALMRDLELAAAAGFTLVRKHLKAEDPRWLHHADRLGMLVWAEPACTGRYSRDGAAAFEAELTGLIKRDRNHPSIVIWGAYNEEWGLDWDITRTQAHTASAERAYRLARKLDPTRPVVDNSGWSHVVTDIVDWHYYNEDPTGFRTAIEALLVEGKPFDIWHSPEFPIAKKLTLPEVDAGDAPVMNSEYGGGWNSVERAWHTRWQTQFLRLRPENQGYVYTELYDIEHETVGIYDFDRRAKDQDGFVQRWAHADTVIIPLIDPVQYGADLVAAGSIRIPVALSHHGNATAQGQLRWWAPGVEGAIPVEAEPFGVAGPFPIAVELPPGYGWLRLSLAVTTDGKDIARTFIDIREGLPESHLPPDSGWRPSAPRNGLEQK